VTWKRKWSNPAQAARLNHPDNKSYNTFGLFSTIFFKSGQSNTFASDSCRTKNNLAAPYLHVLYSGRRLPDQLERNTEIKSILFA